MVVGFHKGTHLLIPKRHLAVDTLATYLQSQPPLLLTASLRLSYSTLTIRYLYTSLYLQVTTPS